MTDTQHSQHLTRSFFWQIVFCAAARTPLTVDVRRVEEQGVANLAVALQVGSPAERVFRVQDFEITKLWRAEEQGDANLAVVLQAGSSAQAP